jgi:isochorismate pyruvate lyase
MNSKPAGPEYSSLFQVREDIDRIDRHIVQLLSQRFRCVQAAVRFKNNEHEVAAPERFAEMLAARRQWAESLYVDPDMVEELFRNMVNRFIQAEREEWRSQQSPS